MANQDSDSPSELFERGLAIRRRVLGDAHVAASLRAADEFTWPVQQLVTEHCWGAVWGRPGLPLRDRSLINLAMLTALNRPHELKVHVHGALNNGVSKEEIMEVLLQAGIYCGAPAALDSFRVAKQALVERGIELSSAEEAAAAASRLPAAP